MSDFILNTKYQATGDQPKAIAELYQSLKSGRKFQTLMGITGSGKTFTMANVIQQMNIPTLVISHNKTLAAQLYGEFKKLFPENAVEYFISFYDYYQPEAYLPVSDTYIEKDSSINDEIDRLRLKATASLMSRNDVIVVASVSCIYGIGDPTEYGRFVVPIERGQRVNIRQMFSQLVDIYYSRTNQTLERGQFRSRGDVIDIYPAYEDFAYRLEFFGNEIEKIYSFDTLTNKKISDLEKIILFPAKHFISSTENTALAMKTIREELDQHLEVLNKEGKILEAARLEQRTHFDLEMMEEIGYCSGIENYERHFTQRKPGERPYTMMDFFPKNFLCIIDESHVTIPQIRAMYNGDRSRKETLVAHGFRLPSALDHRPLTFKEFEETEKQTIFVSATPGDYELEKTEGVVVEQILRPTGLLDPEISVRPTKNQIDDLMNEIDNVVERNERVLVTTLTKKMSEDLTDYLKNAGMRVRYLHSEIEALDRVEIIRDLRLGEFDVLVGINLLREGLDLPEVSLVAIMDADKEGFLRSYRSLMQVSGRAARNANGKVIFYGDIMTDSMNKVIDEVSRRRDAQRKYNQEKGITPRTIYKSREEVLEGTAVADYHENKYDKPQRKTLSYDEKMGREELLELLQREMIKAAERLEFEKAAQLRDEIEKMKKNK
ncbi:MAG: excinuclease ABC subunit UvrB [Candidatus Marinimicrobia bacterium]|nr:excinuclease ABC subunit UvrB [Candidatus Neomarinimicrobiota bacterium]